MMMHGLVNVKSCDMLELYATNLIYCLLCIY